MYIPEERDGLINILMAEDNEADALLSQRSFKKATLKTNLFIVDDGEEAVAFVNQHGQFEDSEKYPTPDVVLLDINMPKLNGLQVLEKIKSEDQTREIPCVILTSSKNEKDVVKGFGLGCSSYIPKPVDYSDFLRIVECFNFYWVAMNAKSTYASEKALNTKILIVEDSENDSKLMHGTLAKSGYRNITCAENGEEALEMIKKEKSEIVIADINLPGIDGVELCKKMKESELDSKVILITGDDNCVDVLRHRDCGAVDYLVKSSDYSTLLQVIRSLTK